jgi:hypothetical protein
MKPDSLNPDRVRYYVERSVLSKRIDEEPQKLMSELAMPPRDIAFTILEDCRLADVYTEEMVKDFVRELLRNKLDFRAFCASEVHGWAREWRIERGYDD